MSYKPDTDKIRAHLDLLKNECSDLSTVQNKEDYFPMVTKKVKLRWAQNKMPLKVYMENSSIVPGFKPECNALLEQAFNDWVVAADGKISIMFVQQKDNADITTRWTNDLSQVINPVEGGDTKYRGGSKGLEKVSIVLLTVSLIQI